MSTDDHTAQALEALGYTPRQAQFLALVAVHGGYFLRRQFLASTGRAHGLAAVRFLERAVTRGDVRPFPTDGRDGCSICARGRCMPRWDKSTTVTAARPNGTPSYAS